MVLAAVLRLQVKGCALAEFRQLMVLPSEIVMNCEGSVMMMTVFKGTAEGDDLNPKFTGSYCRLILKLYVDARLICVLDVVTVIPM